MDKLIDGWMEQLHHKIIQRTLEVKTQLYRCFIYIYIYIEQIMVTANNYMFRPLTGHHHVVHPMKRCWGAVQYTMQLMSHDDVVRQKLHCILYSPPTPFHWMYNLMMTC